MKEKTLYQICIASIDAAWRTKTYQCLEAKTDFDTTGPVTDPNIFSTHNSISISWKKPEYELDIPQGYIVNYSKKDQCKTVIINMVYIKN